MNFINNISIPATYRADSFPEHTVYIPRRLDQLSVYYSKNTPGLNSVPCLFIPFPGSQKYLIYSHGNACDLGQHFQEFLHYSNSWGVNVIAYEYEGYGIAPGSPSADGAKRDIRIVYDFLRKELGVPSENIVIFGTGPSTHLAGSLKDDPPGALILQSPFSTIRAMARLFVGGIGYLSPNPFDNLGSIENVTCPVLFVHGRKDTLIPATMSEELYQACPSAQKQINIEDECDHNYFILHQHVINPIYNFLHKVVWDPAANARAPIEADIKPFPDALRQTPTSKKFLRFLGSAGNI